MTKKILNTNAKLLYFNQIIEINKDKMAKDINFNKTIEERIEYVKENKDN